MKKFIAWMMALCMLLSVAVGSMAAFAEEGEPTVTAEPIAEPTARAVEPVAQSAAQSEQPTEAPAEPQQTENAAEVTEAPADTASGDAAQSGETPEQTDTTETPEQTEAPADEAEKVVAKQPTTPKADASEADEGTGPMWVAQGSHRLYGDADTVLNAAFEHGGTVYLCAWMVFEVTDYTLAELSQLSFAPDTDELDGENLAVVLSRRNPSGDKKEDTVFLWVEQQTVEEAAETVTDGTDESGEQPEEEFYENELMVEPSGYTAGEVCAPTFTLTAIPELAEGQTFGYQLNGETVAFAGSSFAPVDSGEYRFVTLDADGTVLARSAKYNVVTVMAQLKQTAAENAVSQEQAIAAVQSDEQPAVQTAGELEVRAFDYAEDTVSSVAPSFALTGALDGSFYAVAVDGAAAQAIGGSSYTFGESGSHTFVFYLCSASGTVLDSSKVYAVQLELGAPASAEAWMLENGAQVADTLAALLRRSTVGTTIYLTTTATIALADGVPAYVTLLPDPERFGAEYGVIVSANNPDDETVAGTTYVWLGVDVGQGSGLDAQGAAEPLSVTYNGAELSKSSASPTWVSCRGDAIYDLGFGAKLTDAATYSYKVNGVSADFDGSLSSCALATDTVVEISFAIQDGEKSYATQSPYFVRVDNTKPVILCVTDGLTLNVYSADKESGFDAQNFITINGSSDVPQPSIDDNNVYTTTVKYTTTPFVIEAHNLKVTDEAGNRVDNPKEIKLAAAQSGGGTMPSASGTTTGFSGSAGGTASRTVSHSSSDYTVVTAYNGVELSVQDAPMTTLAIGETELDLTIARDESVVQATDSEAAPTFTASFADWSSVTDSTLTTDTTDDATTDNGTQTVDTLILTATTEGVTATEYGFEWTFNGTVYKKLAASGIDYLVFKVGDRVAALSTAGFSAGIRYNLYRAAGLASKDFTYTLGLSSEESALSMTCTVEDSTYAMSDDESAEFYYYDVYTGTSELLNSPFGSVTVTASETDAAAFQG